MTVAKRIAEFWFLLKSRLALLAGRLDASRAALKRAIRSNPNSFMAHFVLARLYWRDRAVVKARREFDLAWQIDPERFERAYERLKQQQAGVPDLLAYTKADSDGVSVLARVSPGPKLGDFRDEEERRRFREMPPITRDEIRGIDWDRFEHEIREEQDGL